MIGRFNKIMSGWTGEIIFVLIILMTGIVW